MEQLGDAVAVYLDGGAMRGDVPSTIVDLTGTVPRLLRAGVISLPRLREVVPLAALDLGDDGDIGGLPGEGGTRAPVSGQPEPGEEPHPAADGGSPAGPGPADEASSE